MYVPHHDRIDVRAETDLELAVQRARQRPLPSADYAGGYRRGAARQGRNQRLVHNILPDSEPADSLLVVEVYTDEGQYQLLPEP